MSDLQLKIKVIEAVGVSRGDTAKNTSDPFVVCKFKGIGKLLAPHVQTSIAHNTVNPVWNQELALYPKTSADILLIKVYDHDALTKDNLLGMLEVPLDRFFQQGWQDQWVQLMNRKAGWKSMIGGHPTWYSVPGQIHIQLWFGMASQANGISQAFVGQQQQQQFGNQQQYGQQGLQTYGTTYGQGQQQGLQGQQLGTQQTYVQHQAYGIPQQQPIATKGVDPSLPLYSSGFNPISNPTFVTTQTTTTTYPTQTHHI